MTLNPFLRANLDAAALRQFFETVETHAHQAEDFKPRRALDVGCGVGCTLNLLAREAGWASTSRTRDDGCCETAEQTTAL